jgi:hypothetical protein
MVANFDEARLQIEAQAAQKCWRIGTASQLLLLTGYAGARIDRTLQQRRDRQRINRWALRDRSQGPNQRSKKNMTLFPNFFGNSVK